MEGLSELIEWFADPAIWQGDNGIPQRTFEHAWIAIVSTVAAGLVAGPAALLLAHYRKAEFVANAVVNIGRAVPSFGIIVISALVFVQRGVSLRFWPLIVALFFLAIPPIFTNTYAGVVTVPAATVEAARGMGLTERQVLLGVELPIAAPVVIAGVRVAFVQVLATVALGAIISSGGGLGQYVIRGFAQGVGGYVQVVAGALLVAGITLIGDQAFALLERTVLPEGVRRLGGDAARTTKEKMSAV